MVGRFSSVIARGVVLGLLLPAAAGVSAPSAIAERARPAPPRVDVLFEPTPHAVVDAMLRLAKVGPEDFLIDLGSGDGRIPIAAARAYGAQIGLDLPLGDGSWRRLRGDVTPSGDMRGEGWDAKRQG